ncbi:peptidoglycan DD-metalloendopeptidase family protein [uncultured Gemmiger sp.]|uniref:murein hydrolase activator EnvC family protein n=1 Tax=uncultured Gemmiger sp. TaxID=1623490 RepID=UPI0025FC481E|nr:peptidoglycan DD-metalloendopeptidase family protein [uncultured Gemmiger sp.]
MHKLKNSWRKAVSLGLSLAMACTLLFSAALPAGADDKLDELLEHKNQLQDQLNQINQKIQDNEAGLADAEAQRDLLEQQGEILRQQIELIGTQISDVNTQIANKQQEIDQKQQDIDDKQAQIDQRWSDFKLRMKAMQRLNDGGSIALLSSITNLYELLSFPKTLEDIYNKDEEVLAEMDGEYDELNNQKQQLENDRTELEASLATLNDLGSQLDGKQNELNANLEQTNAQIDQAEAMQETLTAEQQQVQQAFNEAADAYDAYLQQSLKEYDNQAQIHCSLNFINPLNSYKYISCYFGDGGHGGTDFAAPGGTEIHAMADGVVTNATYHWSYGYYVMITHGRADDGNTYATLYAHMNSAPVVSVGQTVTQGQLLGYVGTTGNSTGNHLHLEMRVNGVRSNVLNYISYHK